MVQVSSVPLLLRLFCLFSATKPSLEWSSWASRGRTTYVSLQKQQYPTFLRLAVKGDDDENPTPTSPAKRRGYDLGLGKNKPVKKDDTSAQTEEADDLDHGKAAKHWVTPNPVQKPQSSNQVKTKETSQSVELVSECSAKTQVIPPEQMTRRKMVARDNASQRLRGALWDEGHYQGKRHTMPSAEELASAAMDRSPTDDDDFSYFSRPDHVPCKPEKFYPDIDLSIPESVYADDGSVDLVWDLLRWEAWQEAQREPLLVSFLYSTILNHPSLESSLAFLLANRLQSPAMMISTQLQSLILDALKHNAVFRRCLRADMMAVRDRDPACTCLPDVFLYFKGFHALQSHRVAYCMYESGKRVLANYLQSQVSQTFQIDIHPNATLGSGIMLDHGTGIVVGETATIGHNCSILHHVTLGGSGKKGVDRHPRVGDGVLLGAGATVLGPVKIGEGSQVGAGTLVISDLPAHCVAVGVPARVIGSFVDVTEQPSIGMNQMIDDNAKVATFESDGI